MNPKCLALAMVALSACEDRTETDPVTDIGLTAPRQQADRSGANEAAALPAGTAAKAGVGACLVQGAQSLSANRLRALGTEPFWGVQIEGRCVTYSHPDDQSGLRIWTRFSGSVEAGEWVGTYGAKPVVLRTRPEPECSDGMSDRRYPIAVTLRVGGEERQGCAEPL